MKNYILFLILPGSIRSKKNSKRIVSIPSKYRKTNTKSYWKKLGWTYSFQVIHPSTAYLKWEKAARQVIVDQIPFGFEPLTCPVTVKMLAYFKGRKPDLSGAMESVGDCLEGFIWIDDTWIESWHGDSRVIHDLKNPRTELTVYWKG